MTIVFYVSGHGFGHASRQVEIINALVGRRPDVRIAIRSTVSSALLSRTLRAPCTLDPVACDSGIIQISSVEHDDAATLETATDFYGSFDGRVRAEVGTLTDRDVALIVGDIPPLAFAVADHLGVPSVAIANFTWDWIYDGQPGFETAPWIAPLIRDAYARATLALELPLAGGFDVFPARRVIPIVARRATVSREAARAHFGLPADRPVALMSFGGYGLSSLDLSRLDCLDSWTVVTTDRVSAESGLVSGVVRLVEDGTFTSAFRYEDLVAACDAVVTKPGYGIIAECVSTGTPMLYTSRGQFREYDALVAGLPGLVRSRFISQAALFAGRWRESLDALVASPPVAEPPATNGAEVAAAELDRMLG